VLTDWTVIFGPNLAANSAKESSLTTSIIIAGTAILVCLTSLMACFKDWLSTASDLTAAQCLGCCQTWTIVGLRVVMSSILFVILEMIQWITEKGHSLLPCYLLTMLAALTPTAMKTKPELRTVTSAHLIHDTFIGTFGCPTVLITARSRLYLYL
jgi:hypothetical protein